MKKEHIYNLLKKIVSEEETLEYMKEELFPDSELTEAELIEFATKEMMTDKLVDYIESHMETLRPAKLTSKNGFDSNKITDEIRAEEYHTIIFDRITGPKLIYGKACRIGSSFDEYSGYESIEYFRNNETWMTEEGRLINIIDYETVVNSDISLHYYVVNKNPKCFPLDENIFVENKLIPEEYFSIFDL